MAPIFRLFSNKDVVHKLEKFGFVIVRRKSRHIMMRKRLRSSFVVVPKNQLKSNTLKGVLLQAGISMKDFMSVR